MAGPNLEVFKFGLYLFFPLAVMIHYGDPEWYAKHVLPHRDEFWPDASKLFQPPRTSEGAKEALAEMREKRMARRQARAGASAEVIEASKATPKGSSSRRRTGGGERVSNAPTSGMLDREALIREWRRIDASREV